MQPIVIIIHVLAAISIISLVLMQHGKGADVGAAFGSGSSNTMFGSQGAMPFLMKLTAALALLFFVTSIGLSYMTNSAMRSQKSVMNVPSVSTVSKPKTSSDATATKKKATPGVLPFVPMPSTDKK